MHLLIIGPLCRSQASVGSTHDCPKIETKIYTSFVFCSCVPFTCHLPWKCFLSTWGKCCKWCHIIFNLLKMQWPKMFSHFEPILSLKSQWWWILFTLEQLLTTGREILHNCYYFYYYLLPFLFIWCFVTHWESGFFQRSFIVIPVCTWQWHC